MLHSKPTVPVGYDCGNEHCREHYWWQPTCSEAPGSRRYVNRRATAHFAVRPGESVGDAVAELEARGWEILQRDAGPNPRAPERLFLSCRRVEEKPEEDDLEERRRPAGWGEVQIP